MRLLLVDRRRAKSGPADDSDAWDENQLRRGRLTDAVSVLGRADWTVNLVLVTDDEMADLNRSYRRSDGVTDVLSFSYLRDHGDGPADLAAGERGACCDLWRDTFTGAEAEAESALVGEVILAPDYVETVCLGHGWDLEAELTLLVIHGILHVLGWTHDDTAEQAAMREIETAALGRVDLEHPLRTRS